MGESKSLPVRNLRRQCSVFRRPLGRRRRRCRVLDRRLPSRRRFLLPRVDRRRRKVPVEVLDHPLHGALVAGNVVVEVDVVLVALRR